MESTADGECGKCACCASGCARGNGYGNGTDKQLLVDKLNICKSNYSILESSLLTFLATSGQIMSKEQVDQILRIIGDSFAMKSANVDLDLALLVINLREETMIRSAGESRRGKETDLNFAIFGKRCLFEVVAHVQLVLHNLTGLRRKETLVRWTNDASVPVEVVVAIFDGPEHGLTLHWAGIT